MVCLTGDAQDRIAGVSTVYIGPFGASKERYWFYRTFVRPDCRVPGLAIRLLRATLVTLMDTRNPVAIGFGKSDLPRLLNPPPMRKTGAPQKAAHAEGASHLPAGT